MHDETRNELYQFGKECYEYIKNEKPLPVATGEYLDRLAAYYGATRIQNESDEKFRKRVLAEMNRINSMRKISIGGKKYVILKRMYRICVNRRSNDWNDEPEYIAVPYEILEEKKKSYVCIRAGWHQINILGKSEFFETKEECELEINRRLKENGWNCDKA